VSVLKQELNETPIKLTEAEDLAIKVLSKTLDMTKLTSEKIEMSTLSREGNKTVIKVLSNKEVDALIAKYEKIQAAEEQAKKEKLAAQQAQQKA
jgi:20S proteasome subunit alpha 3